MANYTDSLRGYSFEKIHKRDGFICQYCKADGKTSFETWLILSSDHLLPVGHPHRNDPEYIVTACQFCNVADNLYFTKYNDLKFDGMSREQLIEQRKRKVDVVRENYRKFWEENVKPSSE